MKNSQEFIKFIKFCLVGISNTLIDFALFNLLLYFHTNIYVAVSVAFLFAMTNSYILNRSWTFKDTKSKNVYKQYFLFVLAAAIGLGINNLVVYLFLKYVVINNPIIQANIIRLSAISVVVFWNYGISRFLIFKHPEERDNVLPIAP